MHCSSMEAAVLELLTRLCPNQIDQFEESEVYTMDDLNQLTPADFDSMFGAKYGPRNRLINHLRVSGSTIPESNGSDGREGKHDKESTTCKRDGADSLSEASHGEPIALIVNASQLRSPYPNIHRYASQLRSPYTIS